MAVARWRVLAHAVAVLLVVAACRSPGATLRSVTLDADGRTLSLEYGVCAPVAVEVEESPVEVVLTVDVGDSTGDDCAGGAVVELAEPLGERRVLVAGSGDPIEVGVHRYGAVGPTTSRPGPAG